MRRFLFLAGSEFIAPSLPEETLLVHPPPPGPGIGQVRSAVVQALSAPLDGPPLIERVGPDSRVLVVFDGPGTPVPPTANDPRVEAVDEVLRVFARRKLPLEQVTLLCATGVSRMYRPTEIARVLGVPAAASHHTVCHDPEALDRLAEFGPTEAGEPVQLDAALAEADLVVAISLVQNPLDGGHATLVRGLASARTARALYRPKAGAGSPFVPGSPFQQAVARAGAALQRRVPVFQLELVLDTRLWAPAVSRAMRADEGGLGRRLGAWNRLPEALRTRASRLFRAEYQLIGALAGSTDRVHARALELLAERCQVQVERQVDVVALGVPAIVPDGLGAADNPILGVNAVGHLLGWHTGRPLVRDGGVAILFARWTDRFERPVHQPHADFYQTALARTRDPLSLSAEFEGTFSGRPEYVSAFRRRHAFHGLHPFLCWYTAAASLAHLGRIIVVGTPREVCERLGFDSAQDADSALAMAAEHVGGAPAVAALAMPPQFGVAVR